jgi:hypothetical protein
MMCACGCGGTPKKFGAKFICNHGKRMRPRVRLTSTGCWIWLGPVNASGYGHMRRGDQQLAHRIAYQYFRGPIPEGMQTDHLCRNRRCVNPWHLEIVTNQVNVWRGALAALTPKKAAFIRQQLREGKSHESLARQFGVSLSAIKHIYYERTWKQCESYGQLVQ